MHLSRPEAEKDHNNNIKNCESIYRGTPDAGAMEGSPDKLRTGHVDNAILAIIMSVDIAFHATPEKQDQNHEIGKVQGRHCHGHNVFKSNRRTNIDER